MKNKIIDILRKMQPILTNDQLHELQSVLHITFAGCNITETTEVCVIDNNWIDDLEDFLTSKILEGKSQATIKHYRYEINRLLSYINKSIDQITDSDISNYLRLYKQFRNVSNQTLKNARTVYCSFFSWLKEHEKIRKNPMLLVEDIKVQRIIKKPFSDEERERMFMACKTLRDRALLEFLYSTAVRVSELSRINISDISFGDKNLIVYGKGSKERRVYLNDRTCMYIKEYLKNRSDDNPALFVGNLSPHNRLTKSGIEYIVRRIGNDAGINNAHPHRFRRTAATNALNRGMPV